MKSGWAQIRKQIGDLDFPRVNAVIRSCEVGGPWETGTTLNQVHLYQLSAAHSIGCHEPFTAEQSQLYAYLLHARAGKKLCNYAWRQYSQSL